MIVEALHYARARLAGQPSARGHLAEQVGIWARHRRQRQAWADHLARARRLCLDAVDTLPGDRLRTALVLGAGVLNDVPLDQLARSFRRVVLADLTFLPATCRLARAMGNVSLFHTDLTRTHHDLPGADELRAGCAPSVPDLSLGLAELDFVYSANVLSQLPLGPLATLAKRHPDLPEHSLAAYGAGLVRAHLEALLRLPCPACLVTDVLERGVCASAARYEVDLLHGVALRDVDDGWTWNLAPRGEEDPNLDIVREVVGCRRLRRCVFDGDRDAN